MTEEKCCELDCMSKHRVFKEESERFDALKNRMRDYFDGRFDADPDDMMSIEFERGSNDSGYSATVFRRAIRGHISDEIEVLNNVTIDVLEKFSECFLTRETEKTKPKKKELISDREAVRVLTQTVKALVTYLEDCKVQMEYNHVPAFSGEWPGYADGYFYREGSDMFDLCGHHKIKAGQDELSWIGITLDEVKELLGDKDNE